MPTLHVRLLGDFLLLADDVPITTFEMPRLQSLLAYLLLHHDAPQVRSHLAFVLWPDSTDAQAHANLRNILHHVRHALHALQALQALPQADSYLHIERQTLQWKPSAAWTLDVLDFEHALSEAEQAQQATGKALRRALEHAVELYRGDLLPGCYDEWILPERDRLREQFFTALQRLISLLEQERDYDGAISATQRLLRHDPLREEAYRQLMHLYAVLGERALALRTYHTCASVLERELGVEPGPATRAAYERLVQSQQPTGPLTTQPAARGTAELLVDRKHEWAELQAAWKRISHGGPPHVVIVEGEAGIGKTRLVEELRTWVSRQGIITAAARCYAAEGELAYAPVVAWLKQESLRNGLARLPDTWLTEVARLVPEILVQRPDLPRPTPIREGWQRQHLFEALARAILNTRQPLLLVLDDLQWCDVETLEWLHYLLRVDPRAQFLLVGTIRSGELTPNQPLASLLASLQRESRVTEIVLGPLDAADTASLAQHLAGKNLDADMMTDLYQETEGNPLFVVEIVRAGVLEQESDHDGPHPHGVDDHGFVLPPTVQAVIAAQLAQLSPPARELAGLAAIIGRAFTFKVLAQAGKSDEDAIVQGLDELWQRRIVREQGGDAYDFSHDKLREGAYAALSSARKRLLHRRVAEALEAVYQENLGTMSGQIAVHYELASLPEQAIAYYEQAGEEALLIFAYEEAISAFQHALSCHETLPRGQSLQERRREIMARILERLGDSFDVTGRREEARQSYQRAIDHVSTQDHLRQAHLYRKIAFTWHDPPNPTEALRFQQEAERFLNLVPGEHSPAWWQEWVQIQLDQCWLLYRLGQAREMTELIEKTQKPVEQYGTADQRAAFFIYAVLRNFARDRYVALEETTAFSEVALKASLKSVDPSTIGNAQLMLGCCRLWDGRFDEAEELLQAALALAERIGNITLQVR